MDRSKTNNLIPVKTQEPTVLIGPPSGSGDDYLRNTSGTILVPLCRNTFGTGRAALVTDGDAVEFRFNVKWEGGESLAGYGLVSIPDYRGYIWQAHPLRRLNG